MLLTNFKPDRTGKKPLYLQIADFIKEQIRLGLEGNLCRCTGYHNIVKAVAAAAKAPGAAAVSSSKVGD